MYANNNNNQQQNAEGVPPRGPPRPHAPMPQQQMPPHLQQQQHFMPQGFMPQYGQMPMRTTSGDQQQQQHSNNGSPAMGPGSAPRGYPMPGYGVPYPFYGYPPPPQHQQGPQHQGSPAGSPAMGPMPGGYGGYMPQQYTAYGSPAPRPQRPAPAPPQPREKRILSIVDPKTQKAIDLSEVKPKKDAAGAAAPAAGPSATPAVPGAKPAAANPAGAAPAPVAAAVQAPAVAPVVQQAAAAAAGGAGAAKSAPRDNVMLAAIRQAEEAKAAAMQKQQQEVEKPVSAEPAAEASPAKASETAAVSDGAEARQRCEAEMKAKLESQQKDAEAKKQEVQQEREREERARREADAKRKADDAAAAQRKAQDDARREKELDAAAKAREISKKAATPSPPQQQQQQQEENQQSQPKAAAPAPSGPAPTLTVERAANGKITYTAKDLLKLKPYCQARPDALDDVIFDVVPVRGGPGAGGPRAPPSRRDTSGSRGGGTQWSRNAPGARGPPMAGGRGGGGPRGLPTAGPMAGMEVEPLKVSEKGWKPTAAANEVEATVKKVNGLLNKLTLENFDRLSKQICELRMTSVEMLKQVVDAIFEKALSEAKFGELYADLCRVIVDATDGRGKVWDFVSIEQRDDGSFAFTNTADDNAPAEQRLVGSYPSQEKALEGAQKTTSFKRILLNKCQEEFERDALVEQADAVVAEAKEKVRTAPAGDAEAQAELRGELQDAEYSRVKIKRRVLGNVQFIGELYKKGILTENVIHHCIVRALKVKTPEAKPEGEDLECLCKLLTTVGAVIDASRSEKTRDYMGKYFAQMRLLSDDKDLDMRHRFMIKDVLELRQNRWQARREELKAKKIEDVHKDAKREEQEKARGGASGRGGRGGRMDTRGGRNDSRGGRGGPSAPLMPSASRSSLGGGSSFKVGGGKAGGAASASASRSSAAGASVARGGSMRPGGAGATAGGGFRPGGGGTAGTGAGLTRPPVVSGGQKSGGRFAALSRANSSSGARAGASTSSSSAEPKIDEKTMHNKVNGALDEYVGMQMGSELVESAKELLAVVESEDALKRHFISHGASMMVNKKDEERRYIPDALVVLATDMELLSREDFVAALADRLRGMGDEIIDAPLCAQVYGQLVAHLVVKDLLRLEDVPALVAQLEEESAHYVGVLVKKVVAALQESDEGKAALDAQKGEVPSEFVSKYKLEEELK